MRELFLTAGVGIVLALLGVCYLTFVTRKYPVKPTAVDLWEQQAYEDYMDLIAMISGAMTPAYMDRIKSKIENFENHYANLIPLKIVHEYVVNLYGIMEEKGKRFHFC